MHCLLLLVTAHLKVCRLAYDISKPYHPLWVMCRIGLCVCCLLKFSVAMCNILLVKKLESSGESLGDNFPRVPLITDNIFGCSYCNIVN